MEKEGEQFQDEISKAIESLFQADSRFKTAEYSLPDLGQYAKLLEIVRLKGVG